MLEEQIRRALEIDYLVCLMGYLFGILIGHMILKWFRGLMFECLDSETQEEGKIEGNQWQAPLMGIIERLLYISVLLLGYGEFIVAWLVIKMAGGWKIWTESKHGRPLFTVSLLGSALSILYAFVGYMIIIMITKKPYHVLIVAYSLIAVNIILGLWLRPHLKKKI